MKVHKKCKSRAQSNAVGDGEVGADEWKTDVELEGREGTVVVAMKVE